MEFLEVPVFDDDIYKLLARFAVNCLFLTLIVRGVYYRNSGSKDYLFTYCMLNVLVFFICFTLKKFDLGLGMALGLFAIFGILRYRTTTIPIREMTYLFIVIGIAVINALANKKMSYIELAFTNGCIFGLAAFLERIPLTRHEFEETVLFEKIDLIRPENHEALIDDLQLRTGLNISRIELGEIDFLRDTVVIRVFYYPHEQAQEAGGSVMRGSPQR
ncbi:DUF4956 domain-containing protein [Pirellulales bacterium]|nr:DUF4956 domain-containing protein [Pirellulales bacterium]